MPRPANATCGCGRWTGSASASTREDNHRPASGRPTGVTNAGELNPMARYGAMYGPDVTFTGIPRCDLSDPSTYAAASAVIVGAPYDSGTSYRSGARMGPMALRTVDYSEHTGSRPHLSLRVDPLLDLGGVDAGDVLMGPTETEQA